MRPLKVVLLLCPDAIAQGVLKLQLHVWRYQVVECTCLAEATAWLSTHEAHVVLYAPGVSEMKARGLRTALRKLAEVQRLRSEAVFVIAPTVPLARAIMEFAPGLRCVGQSAFELREAIAVATKRRPGPKKSVVCIPDKPVAHQEAA